MKNSRARLCSPVKPAPAKRAFFRLLQWIFTKGCAATGQSGGEQSVARRNRSIRKRIVQPQRLWLKEQHAF
jgi:hypothetical protein